MTTTRTTACPCPEELGAFAEGRLGAWKRWKMMRHLDGCEICRDDVAALAEFVAAPKPVPAPVPFPAPALAAWKWRAAAAVLVTIVGAATTWQIIKPGSPFVPLVSASSQLDSRSVEGRLSRGFGWAEYLGPVRSSAEASNAKQQILVGEAGKVLVKAEHDPEDARLQHAAAIAKLLTNEQREAIERLTKYTAEHPDDARAWSDLAAAHHASAVRYGNAADDSRALAAVDRALKIDPNLAEARFNRAVILESLGIFAQARQAWDQYLQLDSTSEWAREARRRRDALPSISSQSRFKNELQDLEKRAAAGDARFVAQFPEESRRFAENATLGQWAAAYARGDAAEAQRRLAIARTIGNELRARSGEHLLADLVAAIDRAGDVQRARLAEAHAAFARGYAQRSPDAAREQYLRAAALFGDTPGVVWARYFAANAATDVETALREFELLSSITSDRHKALFAQIERERGMAEARQVHWSSAIEHYKVALALFTGLGERSSAARTSALIAESSSFLGRRDDAWNAWSAALRAFSEAGPEIYVAQLLNVVANAESLSKHPEEAMSLFDLATEERHVSPALRSEILFRRAMLSARAGDSAGAAGFIARGQLAAARIPDERARENTLADLDVAEGIAFCASNNPQRALGPLTRAVNLREESRQMLLPATLFERARAFRSLGRSDEAMADLQAAVAAVESQRKPIEWRDTKSGALDGVDEIYTTLAELLLERGQSREAFITADRAAAHAFYGADATGPVTSLDALQQRLDPRAVVVEYLVLPRETAIFVIGAQRFETRKISIASSEVARRFQALDDALRSRAPLPNVQEASSHLDAILIAPIRELLQPGTTITFVPDPVIASVPFAALFHGRWLIEDHDMDVVPSALYHDGAKHETSTRVVVISPSSGDVDLPQTTAEVAAITGFYPGSTVLDGRAVTASAVLNAIREANIIHYAGHTDSATEAGLLLRANKERPEIIYGPEIANQPLRAAPLVVLAGCRTLRGGSRREDLATSLARAFLLAGARSVVGTSWDIGDTAASELFTQFHQLNAGTGDSVAALCDAQRFLLQHRQRHPSDWAFAQIVVRGL